MLISGSFICSLLLFHSLFLLALFELSESLFHFALFGDIGCLFFFLIWICLYSSHQSELVEWNMKSGFHWFIFVSFLHALFSWLSSSIFYGYFGCMALCVSPIDDARDWLLDAVGIWSQVCKKKSKLNGFWCDYCFIRMIAWHWGMGYERMVNIWFRFL